jgi:DNA-binding GntR family transcriptional regulator
MRLTVCNIRLTCMKYGERQSLCSLADSGIHREKWARAEWTDLDDQFHSWIVDLSRNPRLRVRARLYTISHRPKPTRSILEHKAIVAALKASASAAALAMMRSHRQRSRVEILNTRTELSQERVEPV